MYVIVLTLHSTIRWFLLVALLYTIIRSFSRHRQGLPFTKTDNLARHWTATLSHIQLILGMLIYSSSPITKYFMANSGEGMRNKEISFFSVVHPLLMFAAIIVLSIGSARAKRMAEDQEKFKTVIVWHSVALLIIFIAIPWPFSPLAERPWFRF